MLNIYRKMKNMIVLKCSLLGFPDKNRFSILSKSLKVKTNTHNNSACGGMSTTPEEGVLF
jgi:hypothetical protein